MLLKNETLPYKKKRYLDGVASQFPLIHEWLQSKTCPLLANEKVVILNYLIYNKHEVSEIQLELDKETIRRIYLVAFLKLQKAKTLCEGWYQIEFILKIKMRFQSVDIHADGFLNEPLYTHPFSVRLFNTLVRNKFLCIQDVLKKSETELLDIPGFGAGTLQELKSVLEKNGYLHLLIK